MKKQKLALRSFRLKNFKAVRDSGEIAFTPLTVFIGNNGSGKSSVIEGLETFQSIVTDGLDSAMEQWRGFEHVWNKAASHTLNERRERPGFSNPISFTLKGRSKDNSPFYAGMEINMGPGGNEIFIQHEKLTIKNQLLVERDAHGAMTTDRHDGIVQVRLEDESESAFKRWLYSSIGEWQFLTMIPQSMGGPRPQKRTGGLISLEKDGSNIAEFLQSILKVSQSAFDGIIETLQFILPYASDLQPAITSEIERNVYLQLTEGEFKVPGWLLSTGTMRLVALLALFRHPTPPPLIVIEEIENGLDPRTIHLIVDEIRRVIESGKSQIIITTHSPYLLDLLHISQIVLVERDETGQPVFSRPADKETLGEWAKKFSPGKLYTMGQLSSRSGE
jgi:predicted ATPase